MKSFWQGWFKLPGWETRAAKRAQQEVEAQAAAARRARAEESFRKFYGVTEAESDRLFDALSQNRCPTCKAKNTIRVTAESGIAVNLICTECQARFWTDSMGVAHPLDARP